ncbi:MAG: GNAT family N-acetyltransferase [Gammaproteobacteria bacterium]
MPIRRARIGDIATLVELERLFPTDRLSARSFRRFIRGDRADVWVYENRNTLLGNAVVLYRRGAHVARLYSLVVAPRARGRGIGSALLDWVERHAIRRRCAELRLEVRAGDQAVIALYRKRGYVDRGIAADYYEDGRSARRMYRPLPKNLRR